jgi:transketolase
MRVKFYNYINSLFKENKDIVILLGDIGVFPLRHSFQYDSSRIYNMGISEQSMIGVSTGLSKKGFIPFVHSIAPFITERCYEQLKLNFGYENINAFLVSVGNSYDYSSLGCTHHCPNDLRIVSSIPNFKTYCPGNSIDVENIIKDNLKIKQPKYIRLSEEENNLRSLVPDCKSLEILKKNPNGLCIVVGSSIKDFNKLLGERLNCTIIYTYEISDFNINKIKNIITNLKIRKKITVVEPCYDSGIISKIATNINNIEQLESISIPKAFIEKYGDKASIDSYLGLNDQKIITKLKKIYGNTS